MAWSSLPMRLNRRRISPRVRLIRRRGGRAWPGAEFCACFAFSGSFVPSVGCGCPQAVGPLFGFMSHDGEKGEGEHCHGDVPVPCVVEADLVVVHSCLVFRCLE